MRAEKQRTRLEFRYLLRQPKPVVSQGETNTETSVPFCYWRYIQCLHCTRCIAGQPYYWTAESNISHAIIVCVRATPVRFIPSIHRSRSEQLSISEQRDVLLVVCWSKNADTAIQGSRGIYYKILYYKRRIYILYIIRV